MSHAFISYKREDREFALELDKNLMEADFATWIDDDLEAGENGVKKLMMALNQLLR